MALSACIALHGTGLCQCQRAQLYATPTMGLRGGWRAIKRSVRTIRDAAQAEQERLDTVSLSVDEGQIDAQESASINLLAGNGAGGAYGEITRAGFSRLARRLDLGPADHFADLGSGVGGAVMHAVTDFGVASSYGVEISPTRHAKAAERLLRLDPAVGDRITYSLADCCHASEWAVGGGLHGTTVAWTCSLLFGQPLMQRVGERLSASANVRVVASLKRFPTGLVGFTEQFPPEVCEMSWTVLRPLHTHPARGAEVYIYRRSPTPPAVVE